MPKIVVRIDPGITHEVIYRAGQPPVEPPPAVEAGARNLRSGTWYAGNNGPQAAIGAAQAGDVIEVAPAVYTSFAVNVTKSLTLRSTVPNQRFVFDIGNGQWRGIDITGIGASLTLEDCELRNNKQEYSNAAGIHPTGGAYTLTLRRCYLHELNNGILIGDHRQGVVLLEDCDFEDCGDYDGYTHNVYVGPVASFTMRRCRSRMVKNRADYGAEPWRVSWGHLVKSRAQVTVIEDCVLEQVGGEGNRCLDAPNGGDVTVRRTRMVLNANIQNNGYGQAVSYGVEEGQSPMRHAVHKLTLEDCDLVNNGGLLKQFLFIRTDGSGVPAPSEWNVRGNRFLGFPAPRAKQIVGTEGAIYEPSTTENTFDGVVVTPPPVEPPPVEPPPVEPPPVTPPPTTPPGPTVVNGVWTPQKNADGTITDASWADLPVGVAVEWAGTSLESQLAPPYGAAGTFRDWGVEGIAAHFDDQTGAAFDEATGRFFCFGGGHAGSSNNMLSCFNARTGKWSVAIPPTAVEAMPSTYARTGLGAYTQVNYPDGRVADNFVPGWQPPGDGRPTAMHAYGGLIYVNGEVVKLRGGTGQTDEPGSRYWHADTVGKAWNKGGAMARPGYATDQHAMLWNGLIYWGAEGGQAGDNKYWTITKYDPAQRKEVGTFGLSDPGGRNVHFGTSLSADLGNGRWLVEAHNSAGKGFVIIDLATQTTVAHGPISGVLPPATGDGLCGVYLPEWQRVLCYWAAAGWVEFDPTTGVYATARVTGARPAVVNGVFGRLRYWSARKVVILHSRTMQNAVVVRTG